MTEMAHQRAYLFFDYFSEIKWYSYERCSADARK